MFSCLSQMIKNPPANAGHVRDVGSIPGLGRSPGGGQGIPLQYSCLENPMDRGAWWASLHREGHKESDMTEVTEHAQVCILFFQNVTPIFRRRSQGGSIV